MKLSVHRDRFQRALGFVERVTSRNATLPILGNILLATESGRLKISATNLEIGVSSLIGAKIETEGRVAVPARILADFVRGLREDIVTLELKQNNLSVKAGRYKTVILCFDASEYPIIPKIESTTVHTVPADDLRALLATVSDSVAITDTRPELAGAFLRFEEDAMVLVATDIFRLAERRIDGAYTRCPGVIIPRGTVTELERILGDIHEGVQIRISDNQISLSHEEFELVSRLIDGRYPDYQKIIPEKSLSKILVRRDEVENAAKTASVFSSSISDIKLEGADGELRIHAKNSSKGEATTGVEANLKGETFEVSMNYRYFLDGLKAVASDKVIMEFTGKGSPFVLRPSDESVKVVYLIMPLRS